MHGNSQLNHNKPMNFKHGVLSVASYNPKGPKTAHLRTLVPKTIPGMVFGTGQYMDPLGKP